MAATALRSGTASDLKNTLLDGLKKEGSRVEHIMVIDERNRRGRPPKSLKKQLLIGEIDNGPQLMMIPCNALVKPSENEEE